ncbi:ATP-binding protein [Sphingomonas jatrophae]|uniref:histidine kinase n=1 Tax=Sphingomonas jatrophae TaxID=1166337 RepID=A0A1I6LBH7_9SPHN|nr:ATP-binding protein [Sphingomonas jatrophae]SFS00794.1 His Kinase A (phospho-acceptor) domain-containing protein [Sphingomonas jatrophae]
MATEPIVATREGGTGKVWRRGAATGGAFAAALLLIALVVLVALSNRARDDALARERRSYDVLLVIRGLDAAMARSEAALGRFVISGDRRTGFLYFDEWRRAGTQLEKLRTLVADDPAQAQRVRDLARLYRERGDELAAPATRATYHQGWPALSMFYEAGKALTIPVIARRMEEIADHERARLGRLSDLAQQKVERSNRLARLLSLLGVALVFVAGVLVWLAVEAFGQRASARRRADEEEIRALSLEAAVAERTRELSDANAALRAEAETRAAAEAQLRQIQKMEAVGQLTGGIAHDFNNMLAVVVGGLDLARRRLGTQAPDAARHLDNALEGANRAAALTRRLLAFARAEPLLPEGVDPTRLIGGMSDLIDRTLGERIEVVVQAPAAPWHVWCDPGQLENAILNAAVNARDAMEGEGRLTIATTNVTLRAGEVGDAPAGDYVRIDIADTGCGMPPELAERVFEPFFTTKPVGKGTGLGLSQIFGFARQSGGEVAIRSAVGTGTTLSLLLPRYEAVAPAVAAPVVQLQLAPTVAERGSRVLVVEDDPRVRGATIGALEELGYLPIACTSGDEALAQDLAGVRLVVTDVVMPGMTGPALAAELARRAPALPVLFVTGYVGEAGDAEDFRGHAVLRKPFTVDQLARAVAEAITLPPAERAA